MKRLLSCCVQVSLKKIFSLCCDKKPQSQSQWHDYFDVFHCCCLRKHDSFPQLCSDNPAFVEEVHSKYDCSGIQIAWSKPGSFKQSWATATYAEAAVLQKEHRIMFLPPMVTHQWFSIFSACQQSDFNILSIYIVLFWVLNVLLCVISILSKNEQDKKYVASPSALLHSTSIFLKRLVSLNQTKTDQEVRRPTIVTEV